MNEGIKIYFKIIYALLTIHFKEILSFQDP